MMDLSLTGQENLSRQLASLMGTGGKIADAEERAMLRFAGMMDKTVKQAMLSTPRNNLAGRRPFGTKAGSDVLHYPSFVGNAPAKDTGSYQKSMRFWTSRIPSPGGVTIESVNFVGVRYASVLEDEGKLNRPVWKPTYRALQATGRAMVEEELAKVVI